MTKRVRIRTRKPDTIREWNRTGQNKRNSILNFRAREKGWTGISEYETAIINDEAEIPEKKNNVAILLAGTLVKAEEKQS